MTVLLAIGTTPSNSTASEVSAGVLGFLVVAGLALAVFFLLRSMNKHIRRVNPPGEAGYNQPRERRPRAGLAAFRAAQAAQTAETENGDAHSHSS